MNDSQIVHINLGLNWTNGSESGAFDYDYATFLIETKFQLVLIRSLGSIEHEPYISSWDDGARTYTDNCIAFRITVPEGRDYSLEDVTERIEAIRLALRQDAVAFDVWHPTGLRDSSVHYGEDPPADALQFDPDFFHYIQ